MQAKWKRVLLLTMLIMAIGTVSAFADDVYESYRAKKIKVTINDTAIKGQALQIDDKTMLPLQGIANSLQAIVKNDKGNLVIYKPNVDIFLFNVVDDKITNPFGQVRKSGKYNFSIFTQVDNLVPEIKALKYEIIDPSGATVYTADFPVNLKDNFWIVTPTISYTFKNSGPYTLKMYMKTEEKGDAYLVAEKIIPSVTE